MCTPIGNTTKRCVLNPICFKQSLLTQCYLAKIMLTLQYWQNVLTGTIVSKKVSLKVNVKVALTSAGYPRMRIEDVKETVMDIAAGISFMLPLPWTYSFTVFCLFPQNEGYRPRNVTDLKCQVGSWNACDLHQFQHQLASRMVAKDLSSSPKHDVNNYNI